MVLADFGNNKIITIIIIVFVSILVLAAFSGSIVESINLIQTPP